MNPPKTIRERLPPTLYRMLKILMDRFGRLRGRERDAEWYDRRFRDNEHWRVHYSGSHYYALWSDIVNQMVQDNVQSIVDIGCGPGQFATLVRDKGFTSYVGLDFSSERIAWARHACPEFEFIEADIFQVDLLEKLEYDCVVCTEFLEHIERDIDVIQRIRSGTRFYGSVPNFASPGHVRYFTSSTAIRNRYQAYFETFEIKEHNQKNGRLHYFLSGVKI